jgi:hypothetical protein
MRWTQLRAVVEREFVPEIAGRLAIHATGYGFSSWGRSSTTFDGAEFVCFPDDGAWAPGWKRVSPIVPGFERSTHLLAEVGEFSSSEFKRACYRFKDLKVTDPIATGAPLLVALACAHRKAGVRTLRRMATTDDLHPLVAHIIKLRVRARTDSMVCG